MESSYFSKLFLRDDLSVLRVNSGPHLQCGMACGTSGSCFTFWSYLCSNNMLHTQGIWLLEIWFYFSAVRQQKENLASNFPSSCPNPTYIFYLLSTLCGIDGFHGAHEGKRLEQFIQNSKWHTKIRHSKAIS